MSAVVVVDTNILVRAVLSENGKDDAILSKIGEEDWKLVYGSLQLKELVELLGYERIVKRYVVKEAVVKELIGWVLKVGWETEVGKVELCRDPDDNYIVGLALRAAKKGKAFLVTSDKDILDLKRKVEGVDIVRPGEFLRIK